MKRYIHIIAMTEFLFAVYSVATPQIQKDFSKMYPDAGVRVNCQLCHSQNQLTPYAQDLKKAKINFKAIEGLDSDHTGKTNLEKIKDGSLSVAKPST